MLVLTSVSLENGSNPLISDFDWIALHSTCVAKRVSNINKFKKKKKKQWAFLNKRLQKSMSFVQRLIFRHPEAEKASQMI